jgi:LysR family glycine cleavage system transcriptional activator
MGRAADALAEEPLLGDVEEWQEWFAGLGIRATPVVVASFSDAGVLLQAAEQGMGIALARELLAADALLDGRLVRVHPHALDLDATRAYHVVYPEVLHDDPAVRAFCDWLHAEIAALRQRLNEAARKV